MSDYTAPEESAELRCGKCQAPLIRCACGQPAQCGESTCGACTPEEFASPDFGVPSAADVAMVAAVTGGGIRSEEVTVRLADEPSGYTEDDVQFVADVIDEDISCEVWCTGCDSQRAARRVLAALAAAGRLQPPDAPPPRLASLVRELFNELNRVGWDAQKMRPHLLHEITEAMGPWVPVDPPKEGDDDA